MDRTTFSTHSIVATPEVPENFSLSLRDHHIVTDQPERAGCRRTEPTPRELLGASLLGCMALYVHKYCEAQRIATDHLNIELLNLAQERGLSYLYSG